MPQEKLDYTGVLVSTVRDRPTSLDFKRPFLKSKNIFWLKKLSEKLFTYICVLSCSLGDLNDSG